MSPYKNILHNQSSLSSLYSVWNASQNYTQTQKKNDKSLWTVQGFHFFKVINCLFMVNFKLNFYESKSNIVFPNKVCHIPIYIQINTIIGFRLHAIV